LKAAWSIGNKQQRGAKYLPGWGWGASTPFFSKGGRGPLPGSIFARKIPTEIFPELLCTVNLYEGDEYVKLSDSEKLSEKA